ncbi:hypothetical protein L9F63_023326 [Diploptera punctata]|uniref:Thiamine transporter 1 n=1 Tax=Diploptera punctata TaxID=6984 RepID=A0AAD8E8S9_DIPPU|nr:hypothetical protein L9F63_023326 [Diploptera punctata]
METWLKYSLLLCVFGFVKELRPSEPFVTHYLTDQRWKNFTEGDIESIFSTGTYAYLIEIAFVFLLTDFLRYKPVIILEGMFAIITWSLLIWGETTFQMQVMEVFYSFFWATEVAYYTYIYAQVDARHYQKVTSHTRAAYLFGRAFSGIVSQILVWTNAMDYYQLNFLTLGAVCFATVWALFIPRVKHSIYFYRDNKRKEVDGIDNKAVDLSELVDDIKTVTSPSGNDFIDEMTENNKITIYIRSKMAFYYLWDDFKTAYTNIYVIKWSLWWAFATCGFFQVLNYVQLIWQNVIENSGEKLQNGIVEAAYTLIGGATSLGCGWLRFNWQVLGESTLALCSIIQGILLIIIATADTMAVEYICYVCYGVLYHTMITVANTEVAKQLREDSYGLIFGVNMFVALVFQSVLTIIVVDENGPLALSPEMQFKTYGGYYLVLGILFGFAALYTVIFKRETCNAKLWLPKNSESLTSLSVGETDQNNSQ